MPELPTLEREHDPCMQIQVDLSAMLDGELDAASVRRVMVHSDACPSCRGFLAGIREQVSAHRALTRHGAMPGAPAAEAGAEGSAQSARLRQALTANRQKLAKILYELGRCFVLMGLSPDFSREVSKEPVPMPDMAMRGRNFLDEVDRETRGLAGEGGVSMTAGSEWVSAREFFDGRWCSPTESLAKGQRLLSECLGLTPDAHESRIYLGLVHHIRGQRAQAKRQFQRVLAGTDDRVLRGYALLNLGNLHLDEGDWEGAATLLHEVVDSGAVERQPRLGMAYFNLGLAYGLMGRFEDSLCWFRRLHDEMPHRRGVVARELKRRSQFLHLVRSHPGAQGTFAETLPVWFSEAG